MLKIICLKIRKETVIPFLLIYMSLVTSYKLALAGYVLGDTDFRDSPIEALYNIEVKHNSKGNVKLVSATPV